MFYLLLQLLVCFHRLVPITEMSVIIAISSAHRQDSLAAVQFFIDTLKATVPIWKKVLHYYSSYKLLLANTTLVYMAENMMITKGNSGYIINYIDDMSSSSI